MAEEKEKSPFEEEILKELYGLKPSKRVGKIKKIWGVRKKEPDEPETWEEIEEGESLFLFKKGLKKIFLIILVLFLISTGIFAYVFYYRAIHIRGVNLNILGTLEVNPLTPTEYVFKIENNSNYQLVDTKLEIELDDKVFFKDDLETEKKEFNIGTLDPKSSRDLKLDLVFIGNANEIKKIKANFLYYTPQKNQEFKIEKDITVTIKKDIVTLQIYAPSRVFVNEPFNLIIKMVNNTDEMYGMKIDLNFQNYYEVESVTPPYQKEYTWTFPALSPNVSTEISIVGKYTKYLASPIIYADFSLLWNNKIIPLKSNQLPINILESPVVLEIDSQPQDEVANLGSYIKYIVKWTNKSSISLNNVKLKVYFEGPFDYTTLKTDGYFDPYENSIIWDARNKPSLLNINPRNSDFVEISISTIRDYPLGKKNLEAKLKAVLETESIPPEVQILSKKLSIETQQTKKIAGKLEVAREILYQDSNVKNTGPYPLVNGKPTTLSFYLKFFTYGEDFQNIIIKTKIPIGVKLTGVVGGEFNYSNLQYSQETGEFVYKIDEIPAGYGSIYNPYTIMFQIEVTPPLFGSVYDFVVISPIEISAQGKFSSKTYNFKTSETTVRQIGIQLKY